jgi:lipoprotein-releasing system permease protein
MKAMGRRPFSPLSLFLTFGTEALAALLLAVGTVFLSSRLGMSPERSLLAAGGASILFALGGGFLAAKVTRKMGFWEIFVSGAVFSVLCLSTLGTMLLSPFGWSSLADIAYLANLLGNPAGGVALVAAVIWGATFVGASLGFLLTGGGRLDLGISYELFIAQSHLRLRKKSPTMLMTVISVGGVSVGVLALTVVLSVMSGFELDLKKKILGTNAHAVVMKYGTDFKEWPDIAKGVRAVRGVVGVTPFILNEVMLSSEQNLAGSLIKGIDPSTVAEVNDLASNMKEGRLEWLRVPEHIPLSPATGRSRRFETLSERAAANREAARKEEDATERGSPEANPGDLTEDDILRPKAADAEGETSFALPGVVLGKELAHSLKVMVGDRVNVVSPLGGELGPHGPMPKSRPFRVAGIFFSGMYEYDAKFAYIALKEAQAFFGLTDTVTGLELKVDDIDNTRHITRSILTALDGYPYRTKDWGEMNKNLFSALRLEKLVMAVILAFIVLVACFNIVSTLIMMVLEKSKEIAILKSMGATDTGVMKIFVIEGLIIGNIGTALGLFLGYFACSFVERVGIRLDAEVYYIDKLPVKVDPLQFAMVAFFAVLLSYLATIYPATRASRMAPVEGLRNE